MRRSAVVPVALAVALALGACGSSGSSKSLAPGTTIVQLSSPKWDKAGPNPSISARMVCEPEARRDIAAATGVKETRVTKPTWVVKNHVYSCAYVYPNGRIVVSVKELVSERTTTAYYDAIQKKYGTTQQLIGVGQGAWILKNNDIVARKDYKVLLVDVQGIPKKFAPLLTRLDAALNFVTAIMSCWSGA